MRLITTLYLKSGKSVISYPEIPIENSSLSIDDQLSNVTIMQIEYLNQTGYFPIRTEKEKCIVFKKKDIKYFVTRFVDERQENFEKSVDSQYF